MEKYFLNIPEELVLLALDESGEVHHKYKGPKSDIVIASAILMDLSLKHRIDTDQYNVIPDKLDALNDPILDVIIDEIRNYGSVRPIKEWISELSLMGQFFRDEIIKSLLDKGILKVEEEKILWMFSKRKYPLVEDKEVKEVKARIRELVFSNEIPDPQDIVIVSILKHADMLDILFTSIELEDFANRINQISKMDMIGLAIGDSMDEFSLSSIKSFFIGESKSPEEMLEEHVRELKEKYRIENDANLPEWIRKGTPQYEKTLEFVRKNNTAHITYNHRNDTYIVNNYSFTGPS